MSSHLKLHEFKPQSLQPDVKYLFVGEGQEAEFNQRPPALPDPFPMLLINCGAPLLWEQENGLRVELPRAVFFPLQTKPLKTLWSAGDMQAIGLNLFAWGTRSLLDTGTDLSATIIPLNEQWQDRARTLEKIFHQRGEIEALATLEQFVNDLRPRQHEDIVPVRNAVELMHESDGQFNLRELAEQVYLSPSQLERRFRYLIGTSPKMVSRLIRLDSTVNYLVRNPSRRMVDAVHRFGFSDQAHFTHEFETFTTRTPREYMAYRCQNAEILQVSRSW